MAEQLTPGGEGIVFDGNNAPGGILVYYADGDEEIIYANQYVIDLFECDSLEDFMAHTHGSFRGFVCPSDIGVVSDNIWEQVDERDGLDHIFYRIETKSGRLVSIDDYGRLVRREGERPLFYVFVSEVHRRDSIDWLTSLPVLAHFKHVVQLEMRVAAHQEMRRAMLVFDIMGMKNYNARYGREAGDKLLQAFAAILRSHFGDEMCCRHAGDRFFALTNALQANEVIEEVFEDFARADVEVTAPVMAGACLFGPGESVTSVIDRVRLACDSDRNTWGSHVTWYTDEMRSQAELRAYVLGNVSKAIERRWIRPYYQAVVRSATGSVCGEEALARWIDPVYGSLSPGQFIPVLEEAGLLLQLDMHIIDCVLEDMATKRDRGVPLVPVSVNVSLFNLDRVDLAADITRKVSRAKVPAKLLHIEFTESVATSTPDLLRTQIQQLHRAGFEVWMDDFGSGYSSLNTLGEFDFDLVKLDMGFLKSTYREKSDIIVDGIMRIAKRMGMRTLAEGVETREQAIRLTSLGCDVLQGFYYARPQSLEDIVEASVVGEGHVREALDEAPYWNAIGSVSLADLATNNDGKGVSEVPVAEFPAGVVERRGEAWHALRANDAMLAFLSHAKVLPAEASVIDICHLNINMEPFFAAAAERCQASCAWERIAGPLEQGTGYQFYVSPIAACEGAQAFVVTSVPTMFGAALQRQGDTMLFEYWADGDYSAPASYVCVDLQGNTARLVNRDEVDCIVSSS